MKQRRGSLYLLTGLILGIILGLVFSWIVYPANAKDSSPRSLQPAQKDQYRALIAMAFVSNGDLVRARARLNLLGDPDPYVSLLEQAKQMAAFGETSEVTSLRLLAEALAKNPIGLTLDQEGKLH